MFLLSSLSAIQNEPSQLAKQRYGTVETNNLLEMLGVEALNNIIHNVKEAVTAKEMEQYHLSEVFPELILSEIEICRLVIQFETGVDGPVRGNGKEPVGIP